MRVEEIKSVKRAFKFNQVDIECCCMVSNRFTAGDLFNAGHIVNNYKNGRTYNDDARDFMNSLDDSQRPVKIINFK